MTTATQTLAEFILARVGEDEAVASGVVGDRVFGADEPIGTGDDPWPSERAFAERLTPARVLAQCKAYRAIVEMFPDAGHNGDGWNEAGIDVLLNLAAIWSDHADYRAGEWAL